MIYVVNNYTDKNCVITLLIVVVNNYTDKNCVITLLIDVVNCYANSFVRWEEEIISCVDVGDDSL